MAAETCFAEIDWKKFNRLRMLGLLRHPTNRYAQLEFLQRKFEREYLAPRDARILENGLARLRDWPITHDPRDPDGENRALSRKLLDHCFELDPEILSKPVSLWIGGSRAMVASIVANAIQQGVNEFTISPPTSNGFCIALPQPGENLVLPRAFDIVHGPLLRELEFAKTCNLRAYFWGKRGDLGISGFELDRREDGPTIVRLAVAR